MLYIGNAFFEWELEGKTPPDLFSALKMHAIIEQLQYLPLLYLDSETTLLVTKYPSSEYLEVLKSYGIGKPPQMVVKEDFNQRKFQKIESWGASKLIEQWSKRHQIVYEGPSFISAKQMNSKLYHFEHAPKLPYGSIVQSEQDLLKALQNPIDKWVLKTDQGFSGRGHCIFTQAMKQKALQFISENHAVILEPWVDRICDFSSQWFISKSGEIALSGVTKCLNTSQGIYQGTETGEPEVLFHGLLDHVQEHINFCRSYLKQHLNGYFGALGVDAMIYKDLKTGKPILHPLVEINARMTLSHALLLFFKSYLKETSSQFLFHSCNRGTIGLLPFDYKRQLIVVR